jgi:hypothetical protein
MRRKVNIDKVGVEWYKVSSSSLSLSLAFSSRMQSHTQFIRSRNDRDASHLRDGFSARDLKR